MALNIPNGFTTVQDYLNHLSDVIETTNPFIKSEQVSETQDEQTEEQVRDAPTNEDHVQDMPTEEVQDEPPEKEHTEVDRFSVYERDLRMKDKRDIDFSKVRVGDSVVVCASRFSGEYSYTCEESIEATLANKKVAQREARLQMLERCKEVNTEVNEDLALLTEIHALRRMQNRTKKVNTLVSLADGHERALESYEAQQILDMERIDRSNERLNRVYLFNATLPEDQDEAITNARHNILKPSVGKKKKRSTRNNTPY